MSLPPVQWSEAKTAPETALERYRKPGLELALSMLWGARNEGVREPFKAQTQASDLEATWYKTEDGWSAPLWRLPAKPGATGEPVILASGIGLSPRSLDLDPSRSLVKHLHDEGFDVYLFTHRGSPDARPPSESPAVDFDGIIAHDVPAAIAVARSLSGAQRVHWIGHGLGGQFLVGHIASDGLNDIAAGVLLSTPVRFEKLKATPRRIAAVAKLLPESWRIPTRRIQEVLTVASRPSDLASLTLRMEGPMARALLTEAADDMSAGLIQQLATWHEHGQLTDRSNRFDYLEGLGGRKAHLLVVGSPSDNLCSLTAAKPAFERLAPGFGEWLELDGGWGHLDLIAGADARRTIFPRLSGWLEQQHKRCWTDR